MRTSASDSLTQCERELIASYTSRRNDCFFGSTSHGAAADYLLGRDNQVVDGLATWAPQDPAAYAGMGEMLATQGYVPVTETQLA